MALFCYAILQGYFNNGAFTCPFEKIKYIRRIETKRVDSVVSEDYYDTCHYACERGKFFKDVFISLKQAGLIKDVISGNCCIS